MEISITLQAATIRDSKVGKNKYLLFLTADHAASDQPNFLESSRLPGRFFDTSIIKDSLNSGLSRLFGDNDYVSYIDKTQIYLKEVKIPKTDILAAAVKQLKMIEGITEVYVPCLHSSRNLAIDEFFRRSYNMENSGDILLHCKAGWMPTRTEGTTHGSAYNDDTHVPLLWYGWNIHKGETVENHTIDQIAPTLSMLLDITLPNTSSKELIEGLFD